MTEDRKNRPTYFEWIQLIVTFSIPIAITVYTILENNRELAISSRNRNQDLEIADGIQKDAILREYQKTLSRLVEKHGLFLNSSSSASLVARFATISALSQVDPVRRKFILCLLYDAKLITYNSIIDLPVISLDYANLTDICLTDQSIRPVYIHFNLEGAILIRADFHRVSLHGARLNKAILRHADFSFSDNVLNREVLNTIGLNNPSLYFEHTDLTSASFSNAMYEDVSFEFSEMINANLDSLSCVSCNFSFSSMRKVDMINVTIEKSMFDFVELPNASLHRAKFGKHVSFYGSSMYGVNGTYTYFKHCQFEFARLNYAILDYTKIEESKFYNAQIIGTSMKYGVLIRVNFTSAYLFKSKWNHIRCEQCIFHSTNFTDTDLTNAMFIQSDFRYALITEEQLRQAASLKGSILPNGTVVNEK